MTSSGPYLGVVLIRVREKVTRYGTNVIKTIYYLGIIDQRLTEPLWRLIDARDLSA